MKKQAAVVFTLCALVLVVLVAAQQQPSPPVREIKLTAKKYEYSPNEIRVRQGERVRLLITALDRTHGFELEDFKVKADLEKGKETVVEFVADRVGEFPFNCSHFCGFGHKGMKGKLIVEPAGAGN